MPRIDKVQEELRQQISMIVQQELEDPRIGFITITRVEVTPDLREARVYFTAIDDNKESLEATSAALNMSAGFVRKLIARRVRMKFTPRIDFIYDYSLKSQTRIDEIINRIHREKGDGE